MPTFPCLSSFLRAWCCFVLAAKNGSAALQACWPWQVLPLLSLRGQKTKVCSCFRASADPRTAAHANRLHKRDFYNPVARGARSGSAVDLLLQTFRRSSGRHLLITIGFAAQTPRSFPLLGRHQVVSQRILPVRPLVPASSKPATVGAGSEHLESYFS